MDLDQLRTYCLSKKGATEDLPFGPDTLAFRVMGKIFGLIGLDNPELSINLKCEPEYAISLREQHPEIIPGFHMNKQHWNTVHCQGALSTILIHQLVDHSYDLIVASLKVALREELKNH